MGRNSYRIDDFKDTCSGPIFVLGNGPSLDTFDINNLPYSTFGVNRSWRKIYSKWHFISAPDCYFRDLARGRWIAEHIFTPGSDLVNCERKLRRLSGLTYAIEGKSSKIDIKEHFVLVPCGSKIAHKLNIKRDVFPFVDFTIAGAMALQIAKYMGFDPIYLLGFDGGHVGHFKTDDIRDNKSSGINHDKNYYSKLTWKWRNDKTKIYNCNLDSQIRAFPFKPIGEIT